MMTRHSALLLGLMITGCTDNLSLFDTRSSAFGNQTIVELPNSPSGLNSQAPIERDLKDAFDLAEAKRWGEARQKMGELAGRFPVGTDFWAATKCTEANFALAGNDIPAFRDAASAIDRALNDRGRLRPPCPEMLAISRHLSGSEPAPITTPDRLTTTLDAFATSSPTAGRSR